MERKRRLPARAAARVENEVKRRKSTPRERSEEQEPEPVVETRPQPPPLPRSVESGKPLPTVESAQDDVSTKDFQSVGESGVLAESLSRSRNRWINDGLFEKYWTKPHKRKGVINEDPKNPPKETMSKVGTVTITIEPHIIDATMYVVKDPKPKVQPPPPQAQQPPPTARPIIQYGPPGGSMPSQTPTSANASPAPEPSVPKPAAASPAPSQAPGLRAPSMEQPAPTEPSKPTTNTPSSHSSQPQRPPSVPASTGQAASPAPAPAASGDTQSFLARPPSYPPSAPAPAPAPTSAAAPPAASSAPTNTPSGAPSAAAPTQSKPPSSTSEAPAQKAAATDPVIALLAQRASGDVTLRDLMRRVAVGQAKAGELQHFQDIIDDLKAELKKTGGQQGPAAEKLIVDGKTVRYFADEVCVILDIVLASNPNQRASDLRPPPRSNPVVIALVKKALDDTKVKDMCRRISTSKPNLTDPTDLKDILDRLLKDFKPSPQQTPAPQAAKPNSSTQAPNGLPNGHSVAPAQANNANFQALRSKGPPPSQKADISAVLFDFGSGDRYLFPKFSMLQPYPAPHGQQVIASFLLVRKGSTSDYGGDPELDYYQPVTIRIWTPNGRHLENLFRVVAPADEVRRYMDDVMDNMKRAEYILLAMRLPRTPQAEGEEPKTGRSTPLAEKEKDKDKEKDEKRQTDAAALSKPAVLWTTSTPAQPTDLSRAITSREAEEETQAQYRRLINSISAKEPTAT